MEVEQKVARDHPAVGRAGPAAKADRLAAGEAPAVSPPDLDPVDLTAEAEALLEYGAVPARGKAAQSPAHRARALVAEHPHLAGLPFGQVVSGLVHGTLDLTPPADDVPDDETGGTEAAGSEPETDPVPDPAPTQTGDGGATIASVLAEALAGDDDSGLPPIA